MADDNVQVPYKDDALQYADLIGNVLNPPAAGPYGATPPAPAPSRAQPAAVPAQPAPAASGLAPNQHWESVTPPAPSPAATTRSGDPSTQTSKTWSDIVRANQGKLQQDQGELSRLQTTGPGVNQIKNPFLRGLAKVGDVAGTALSPRLAAAIPGTTQHNLQLQGQAQGRVGQDEEALRSTGQMEDREAQAQERTAQANRQNAQADSYQPVTLSAEQAAAIGHPELTGEQIGQRAYAQMISGKARTDAATTGANARTQSAQTAAGARTTSAQTAADARTQSAQTSADARKFAAANRATAGRGPNDAARQPMIDAATAQINKLNTWTYDPDQNDGKGGFYDPSAVSKVYSPEEFTALKNQISTKLDKDLATKKLQPLGVRFNANSTKPTKNADGTIGPPSGEAAPAQTARTAQKPTPATQKTAPAPQGATHMAPGSDGQWHYTDGKNDLGVVK